MPRQENVITVFVASPSDLEAERNLIEVVIHGINQFLPKLNDCRLELVRWETHAHPGVGQDPQDVLKGQLPEDYDIFIGLMWSRFGTPTNRAGSGTEEEFNHALERHRNDSDSVEIMFYFKDASVPFDDIDPDQFQRVRNFRKELEGKGVFYWKFKTPEQLERDLRNHLLQKLAELGPGKQLLEAREVRSPLDASPGGGESERGDQAEEGTDDFGLIEYLELTDERFGELVEISERIASETVKLSEKMDARTEEMQMATQGGEVSRSEGKRLVERAAKDMKDYATKMKAEVPLFKEAMQGGSLAVSQAMFLSMEMKLADKIQASKSRNALVELRDALTGSMGEISSFQNTVRELPRLTTLMNRAKRDTVSVLQYLLDSMADGERLLTGAINGLAAAIESDAGP